MSVDKVNKILQNRGFHKKVRETIASEINKIYEDRECKLCKAQRKVYEFNFDEKLSCIKDLEAMNKALREQNICLTKASARQDKRIDTLKAKLKDKE